MNSACRSRTATHTGHTVLQVRKRPLDVEAGHERFHKDRRLGLCETHVSGAKEERRALNSAVQVPDGDHTGRTVLQVRKEAPRCRSGPRAIPRAADSGHVTHVSVTMVEIRAVDAQSRSMAATRTGRLVI